MNQDDDLAPADHQHQSVSSPAPRSTKPRWKRNCRLASALGISAILGIHPVPALLSLEHLNITVFVDSTVTSGNHGSPLRSVTPPVDTSDEHEAGG